MSVLIASASAGPAFAATATPSSDKLLTGKFYQIELIVFMRLNVSEANTSEQLTSLNGGRLPARVASFASVDGDRGYPFELEPKTRRMLQQSSRQFGLSLPLPGSHGLVSQVSSELAMAQSIAAQALGAQGSGQIDRTGPAVPTTIDPETALNEAIALYEEQLTQSSFAFRSDGLQQLSEVAGSLNRSRGYRVLHTGSWHQPVPSRKEALPLLIQTGIRTDDAFQLEGAISIGLGRYLHVGADFWYYEPELGAYTEVISMDTDTPAEPTGAVLLADAEPTTASESTISEPIVNYRTVLPPGDYRMHLSEKRRMRSAELHYLDHPKLGVLVRIDPVPLSDAVIAAYQSAREG